jgi:putative two-component system protein, hydrogenase maturation factor HypX/HoxX
MPSTWASDAGRPAQLTDKRRSRARDEQRSPLAAYRADELARSHEWFIGADRSYHEARRRFVYKLGSPCAGDNGMSPV